MKLQNKVLIVDDSELNRSLLADMLQDEYEILEAENGLRAVKLLEFYQFEISLILLDIMTVSYTHLDVYKRQFLMKSDLIWKVWAPL